MYARCQRRRLPKHTKYVKITSVKYKYKSMAPLDQSHDEDENPELQVADLVDNVLRAKKLPGMQTMQRWFNKLDATTKEGLLRANDISTIGRFMESLGNPGNMAKVPENMLKNVVVMAASVGLLDVDDALMEKSRGIAGAALYRGVPNMVAKGAFKLLGAPEVYPIWLFIKGIVETHEDLSPKVREEVKRKMQYAMARKGSVQAAA